MTDAHSPIEAGAENPVELRAVIQRRLVGLIVLLAALFLAGLWLRNTTPSPEALPSVVIPLGGAVTTAESRPNAETGTAAESQAVLPQAREELVPSTPVSEASPPAAPADRLAIDKPKPRTEPPPKPAALAKPAPAKPAASQPDTGVSRWFVAVGAYKDPMAAQAIASRVKLAGFKTEVSPVTVNKDRLQRVRAGPFASKAAAEAARATLIVEGLTKAVTVADK